MKHLVVVKTSDVVSEVLLFDVMHFLKKSSFNYELIIHQSNKKMLEYFPSLQAELCHVLLLQVILVTDQGLPPKVD